MKRELRHAAAGVLCAMALGSAACAAKKNDCAYWLGRIHVDGSLSRGAEVVVNVEKGQLQRELGVTVQIVGKAPSVDLLVLDRDKLIAKYSPGRAKTVVENGDQIRVTVEGDSEGGIREWLGYISVYEGGRVSICQF
jgi:hypothetical protein